jgi:hypothetical protein
MTWEAIGALSQLIAAIAVIASVVYLGAQIRQNTRQLYEQTRTHHLSSLTAVGEQFVEFRASISRDRQVASVWLRGIEDLAQLTAEERLQFDFLAAAFFWALATMYIHVEQGVFERELFDHSRDSVPLYAGPGLRQWWRESPLRRGYPPAFLPEIDRVLEATTSQPIQ